MASVGSAVGMANVWGVPHKLGSNGGGAFLLVYLLFVFIFSYVGLPTEFAIGRRAGTGTLGAVSWFYVMKREDLLDAVNTGSGRKHGRVWYAIGRYVYVPLALILCLVALIGQVAF